jgi:hypothetical protein
MDPLRPLSAPAPTPAAQGADAARLAAQKAFFEMAMGRAQAPAAAPPQAQTAAPQRVPSPGQPAPDRPLRPGSLLDIRV